MYGIGTAAYWREAAAIERDPALRRRARALGVLLWPRLVVAAAERTGDEGKLKDGKEVRRKG